MPRAAAEPLLLAQLAGLPPVSRLLVEVAFTLARWENRRRTRHALNRLDPHLLTDIGLSPVLRDIEGAKPFWRG